jgi:hypothetical protein
LGDLRAGDGRLLQRKGGGCLRKYWPPFGNPGDFESCRAEQEAAKKLVWDWLAKYGVKSQLQLESAIRHGRLFALLADKCMREGEAEGVGLVLAPKCITDKEAAEKAAGTDLGGN